MRHAKALATGFALGGTALYALGAVGLNPWQLLPLALVSAAHLSVTRLPMSTAAIAGAAFAADSALDPVHGPSPVTLIAFTNVLYWAYTCTTPRRRNTLEIAGLVCVVGGALTAGILGGAPRAVLGTGLYLAAVFGLPLWWARDVLRSADLARLDAERARREERAAMARDLHDVVAGHLTGIALQSEAALAAARRTGADTTVLAGIRTASLESLAQMRTMIDLMRIPQATTQSAGPEIATTPGLDGLPAAVDLARAAGLDVHHHPSELPAVDPLTGQTAHRVLTEALTNARKHAAPGPVHVAVTTRQDQLVLRIDSPLPTGRGYGRGHGLDVMHERVAALAGTLTAAARPDLGVWRVETHLPLSGTRIPA